MTEAMQISQPSYGRRKRPTLRAICLLLSVVVFIAGCQNGGQDDPDEPTDVGGAEVELDEPADEGRAEDEPDDPTDVGGAEKAASCPPVRFTDVSCYPRGNVSDPDLVTAKWFAGVECANHSVQCHIEQGLELVANRNKCVAVGCTLNANIVSTDCRPTNPGQPCFFRPSTEMHVCSYKGEVNWTDYSCEVIPVVPEGEEGEPM